MSAGTDWEKNWRAAKRALEKASRQGARLIALPEFFYWRGPSEDLARTASEGSPVVLKEARMFARKKHCAVLLGSLLERSSHPRKFYNTSYLISEKGTLAAKYRKIHLFDTDLKPVRSRESKTIARGRHIVSGKVWGIRCGLSVCYDLRFPELYRKLSKTGAKIFFIPANFTYTTGLAHWETLLKARAIENQAFMIAPAQTGVHPSTGIRSFGNSRIIDPWGRVLAGGPAASAAIVTADLNFRGQEALRKSFPVLCHRRLT